MAKFTVRVELHDARTWNDYNKLHAAMENEGFSRAIESNGVTYHLPTAEYNRDAALTLEQILESANNAASSVDPKSSILVTESNGRIWQNLSEG